MDEDEFGDKEEQKDTYYVKENDHQDRVDSPLGNS